MPNDTSLLSFIIASLIVLLLPGPGVLYVVARSVSQGYHAGLVSALGLSFGALVHVIAAAAGLSAILLTSATAFNLVKLISAGYLIYLGLRTLFDSRPKTSIDVSTSAPLYRLFTDGVIVSIFNPKIALFFLAFLPQFIEPSRGSIIHQILLLGFIYAALAFLTDGSYALLADRLRNRFSGRIMSGPLPRYVCSGLYLGLGVNTALTGRRL